MPGDPDTATEHDPWMLPQGEYIIAIGLFTRSEDGSGVTVQRRESHIQIKSKRDARYYFNQFTDLKRRVTKLEKAAGRLF